MTMISDSVFQSDERKNRTDSYKSGGNSLRTETVSGGSLMRLLRASVSTGWC
jgi:hypothetical protein